MSINPRIAVLGKSDEELQIEIEAVRNRIIREFENMSQSIVEAAAKSNAAMNKLKLISDRTKSCKGFIHLFNKIHESSVAVESMLMDVNGTILAADILIENPSILQVNKQPASTSMQ